MPRALAAISTAEGEEQVCAWLGDNDWRRLADFNSHERVEIFLAKFRSQLGYRSVKAWPIYARAEGQGSIMYYMIHATDHEEAPKLMYRAYRQAVRPPESLEQLELALEGVSIEEVTTDL